MCSACLCARQACRLVQPDRGLCAVVWVNVHVARMRTPHGNAIVSVVLHPSTCLRCRALQHRPQPANILRRRQQGADRLCNNQLQPWYPLHGVLACTRSHNTPAAKATSCTAHHGRRGQRANGQVCGSNVRLLIRPSVRLHPYDRQTPCSITPEPPSHKRVPSAQHKEGPRVILSYVQRPAPAPTHRCAGGSLWQPCTSANTVHAITPVSKALKDGPFPTTAYACQDGAASPGAPVPLVRQCVLASLPSLAVTCRTYIPIPHANPPAIAHRRWTCTALYR